MNIKAEFCLLRDRTRLGFIDTAVTLLVIVGLALNAWGIVANGLVIVANDGFMPVISEQPGMVLTDYGFSRQHVSDGSMLLLADRIRIDFPDWQAYVPGGVTGRAVSWWVKWLDYPIEGGLNMVSVGDIARWTGTLMFLLGTVLLVALIVRRLFSGDVPRVFKK